jgi:maltose O-acetyltransferase
VSAVRRLYLRQLGRLMGRQMFRKLLGMRWRLAAWRALGARIEDNVGIGARVWMRWPQNVSIGEGSKLGGEIWLDAGGGIEIGRNVLITHECSLLSTEHALDSPKFKAVNAPIRVGDYVWIPYRVIVLPGTTIGDHAVIGSGSVVRGEVEPYAVAAGNPARVIGRRAEVEYTYVPARI